MSQRRNNSKKMDKLWCFYTMEYYLSRKMNKIKVPSTIQVSFTDNIS